MEDNSRKRLYDKLSESYNLGTFEEFDSKMGNDSSRRALYDKVTEKYNIGTFEEFNAKMGNTHKQNLDAFNTEYGSFMNDFESRDSAETKMSRAGMSSGLVVPVEGSITGEERQRYLDLHKQEEALKKAWYNSPDYLAQKDADALFLSQMRDSIDQGRLAFAQANPMVEGYNPSATRGAEADKELQMYETASRIMEDVIKLHNAPSKYDGKNAFLKFGKGSADTLSDLDFWTAGLTEIADNFGVRDVLNSVQSKLGNLNDLSEEAIEDILSPAEKAVLQAWALNAQEQVNRKDDLARAYQAGQSATESLGFMAEFALTGGVGKAASEGVETMAKWLGRKVLGQMDDATAATVREAGEKIAKSTVGKYGARLADALAETAGKTFVMPSTFRNISEKAAEIQEDAEGNRYLTRMNDAFAKGFADSFIENLSEGGRVNAIGDLIGDVAGKIPAYKKIVDKFANSKAGELLSAFNSSGIMNTLRAGGWHGFGEEYLEEWYGNALRTITGLDKEALKDFATVDNQLITITSFLPMTIFGGTVSTAQVLSAKKGLDKKAEMLRSALLERGYDEKQADNMIDMMRGSSPAEISQTLTPIVNAVALRDVNEAAALMKPVGEFAEAVRRWQAFDTKYQYQEQEQRDNLRNQMTDTLGQFWQEDENGRQVVQRGVNANGEVVYLLGKPSATEAQSGAPQQVAAITSEGRKVFVDPAAVQLEGELEMNDFLGNEVMAEKGNKEQARMIEEKEKALAQVRQMSAPGTSINLGTTEAPMVGTVAQRTPDGVVVAMQDGSARQVSYEELGNYIGVNTTPLTDVQMDESEADALVADKSQREAELDQEYENLVSSETEIEEAQVEVEQAVEAATPLPTKADGSVDQTTLWNQNPERWAEWNDEQRQDGGVNSLGYINAAITREKSKVNKLTKAYDAEPDFDVRASMEPQIKEASERINRLVALQQKYAPLMQTEEQQSVKASEQPASEVAVAAEEVASENPNPVRQTLTDLYNDPELSESEIEDYINANVERAQSELDKHTKKAPKMGTDMAKYKADRAKHQEQTAELEKQRDFWKEVQSYVEVPAVSEMDMEPQNALEFTAKELTRKDGVKLLRDSFARHTGYGSEAGNFLAMLRSKDKGGLSLEEAGERLMEIDRENNTGFFDQNDPNAGLNAILDVISGARTSGDVSGYIRANREQLAREEVAYARNAMMEEVALRAEGQQNPTNNAQFEYYEGNISSLVEESKATSQGLIKKIISPASERLIADLNKEGVSIDSSYNHTIDNSGVRHILKQHGTSKEYKRGQIPINEGDFLLIEDIINNYDEILTEQNKRGQDVIVYVKSYPDGTTYYVEEVRVGRKELAADSMYKRKNRLTDANGNETTQISDLSVPESSSSLNSDELLTEAPIEERPDLVPTSENESSEDKDNNIVESTIKSEENNEGFVSFLEEDMPDFENMSDDEVVRRATEALTTEKEREILDREKRTLLRDRISSWEQKLGVQVDVMESVDDVANAQAKQQILNGREVFGWFEVASGKVAFYLPDYVSLPTANGLSEIDKTYIHEVVSHRGLRGLLGEEKYGELCDMVWDAMTEEQKTKFLNYPGVNGNTRAAADEFIAHFAENVDYNNNRTLWDKIVDFIKGLFYSVELPVNISNESLADLLRMSYSRLAKNAATVDTDSNQQAEGNTMFRSEDGSLVGMHNISEDKLRKVIKQGGAANPSTAVIDIDRQIFGSYGEISFIMPSSLVDAGTGRNAGTFTADAWTPTYPQVSKRFSDDKLQRAYWRDISAIPEEMSHEVRMAFDSWLDNRNASGLAYMFLHERGEAPEIVRVEAKFPQEIKDKVSAILGESRTGLYGLSAEEKQAMLELYIQENFGGNREEFDKSIADRIQRIEDRLSTGKVPSFVEKRITLDLQWMKEHAYDYDELSKFVSAITADIRHAGEVNDAATTNRALDYIKDNDLEKEFDRWKESLNDRYGIKEYLFDGYTPSGNQRWLPNTVENASRLMNKQGLAGATGMAASFNRFVATLAPKKKTLSDIRASKDRLVEDEELVDDFREKWSEVFFDLGVKCQPDAKGYEDYGLARLTEAAQKKNPGAYLKKEYGVELSQEDLQKLSEMIKAIKTEFPARYFETKFQRPVYLNEFAAAVIPTTTSEDIKQAVAEAGLPIFEYNPTVEGSRKEATIKATEGEGIRFRTRITPENEDIRFRMSNENQAIFVSNAAKAVEAIKQEKATPEQWLKMIEKNGGLKAGEDKWMGLSDWLKASEKKTLTKQEVLDFINENMIVIEEVHYIEGSDEDFRETAEDTRYALQEIYDDYIAESEGMTDDMYMSTHYDYAIQKLAERLGYEAWNAPFVNINATIRLDLDSEFAAAELNDIRKRLGLDSIREERTINDTRLSYTTKGLTDRHEIALTVPTIEPWNEHDEVHFGDAGEGRAVAWIRFGETFSENHNSEVNKYLREKYNEKDFRSGNFSEEDWERLRMSRKQGRKVLVIDEIQSKRHQEGRERGYKKSNNEIYKALEAFQSFNRSMKLKYGLNSEVADWGEDDRAEFNRLRDAHSDAMKGFDKGVPDAPFDKNWHELAMKRMLRYAAENGYDVIAWTKGDQQAERYNIGNVIDAIYYGNLNGNKIVRLILYGADNQVAEVDSEGRVVAVHSGNMIQEGMSLAEIVGKEIALKIMNNEGEKVGEDDYKLSGEGLRVGGEGMRGFYDKMLPAFMNKYGKKWGVKVEDIELPNLENGLTMHSLPVTEEMKASVMEGQVMFRMRGENESAEDFLNNELGRFRGQYSTNAKMAIVDYTSRESIARTLGISNEELSDDLYNRIMAAEKKSDAVYLSKYNTIAIFAREEANTSGKADNIFFHENVHEFLKDNAHWLNLGQWLLDNSNSGPKKVIADRVKSFYPEQDHAEEMLCNYTGLMLSLGRSQAVMNSLPEEMKPIWEEILNKFNYNPEYEDSRRKSDRAGDADARRDASVQMRNASDERARGARVTWTRNDSDSDLRFRINENPTEAQKEAGNYKMGHLNLDGYRITIENPKGSVRRGTDSKGNAWENTLNNDYGYIRGTEGVDGDHIDVYLSDNPSEGNVFVVDQVNPQTREFDEHKVMYGFNSAEEAREAYLANFSEGWNGLGTITEVSKEEFKKWIDSSHRKTKPFSEYKSVNAISMQSEGISEEVITGTPTEEVVASGLSLSPAQLASLAGDIFAALPEESRKKITDGLNGNIFGLQDAILQIPTSLAMKESWDEEDKAMADVVAAELTKIAGEMTRPFSASEGLWVLYNALNPASEYDILSQASRALVQRNLGFDPETLQIEDKGKEGVRFRTVGDARINATASLYNRGAVNVWTRIKESFVDMNASVEELVKAIEKMSGKAAEGFENVLMALNQQSSKGLAAMESYEQKFLKPMYDKIRDIMNKTDFKYEDIVRYVILKHGLERNEKMAQRDAKAHYQEIYDEIIAKIKGMNPAQKRTYLTNAQLRDTDAKAELARLQAVNTSVLTPDQLTQYKKDIAKAKKEATEAAEHLARAQKIATLSEQDAQDELDKIFKKIKKGTDSVYKEMRKNDYSGISSMFYDQLGVNRKDYSTEEEYQAALMQAKADKYDNLSDIEGAAQMEVTLFENAVDTKDLWKSINNATKETLRQQYEANMISKDQYDNLRNMFEFYVPLRGFKDNTAEDMYTYYRKPNSTGYTKPILGAEGRKTEAESPFGWIAAMAGSAIASNVKNEAKLALYYFVANRPDNGVATLSRTWFVHTPGDVDANGKKIFRPAYPPFNEDLSTDAAKQAYEDWQEQMKDLQKQGLAYEAGQRINLGNAVVNISDTNKPEHIVNVKVGGKDYTIVINGNPRAAQAINGDLNIEATAQDYSALFGPVLRWMSSVNTSYNPEFWITNLMRDMAFTWMAVNTKEDPAYRRRFSKNYRKAFRVIGLAGKNEKGTLGGKYIEQMYQDFVKYGGVTGYTQIKDNETWEKEIEKYIKSNAPDSTRLASIMKGTKDAFHAFHRFGESLEQVSRFAAFLTSREMGKSIPEAINDAKEITVNFNRKGSGKMITLEEAKYLTGKNGRPLSKPEQWAAVAFTSISPLGRRFIMFFNAAIQGLNATYKLWKKNPSRFGGWALAYTALGVMNATIHALIDDDDDYLDMPQYERRTSLMIGYNGAYLKWALPQEAKAFYALGDLAVESIMGRNPHQNLLGEATKIVTELSPINPTEGVRAVLPSIAIPAVELALNKDYKGDPIYNDQKWLSEEEKKRTARWSKAYSGTGKIYVDIAKGLNALTGGDEYDAGLINLQPEKIQHIVQSAFGGTIRTADKFVTTVMAAMDPEEDVTIRQLPFLNRILTINDERFKNVHVNDVYDYYKADAEHALTLEKQYKKNKDKDALNDLRESDEYQWAKIYMKYKKPLEKIQEKIKVAEGTAERKDLMRQQDQLKKDMIKEISELP